MSLLANELTYHTDVDKWVFHGVELKFIYFVAFSEYMNFNAPRYMLLSYSHYGNEVRNGAIFITQWGFINDCNKILVMAIGFVDNLGQFVFQIF